MRKHTAGRALFGVVALAVGLGAADEPASAQWSTTYEQFYLPAKHNWEFRQRYTGADRLFNAFDYGHAKLYETLWNEPNAPASRLEEDEYRFLTTKLLVRPPRMPLEEGALEVAYAKLAPEAKAMFDWAHLLHRQIYDVWADESIPLARKDAKVAEVLAYYNTRPEIAFSSVPKSMDIMDGQYFGLALRRRYPKFNGLIWAYHWLQIGLYEPLMVGDNLDERQAGVSATVGRFWQMLQNPPQTMPHLMPMTPAVAPTFARRYPEASAIFDNLHMMHDVIGDILASPEVPRGAKRQEILRQVELFRSDTAYAIGLEDYFAMAEMMGANNMGGPAVGFLAALPEPTVPFGASMAGMGHGNMQGMQHGNTAGGQGQMQRMQHGNMNQPGQQAQPMQGMDHSRMGGMQQGQATGRPGMQGAQGMQGGNMQGMQHREMNMRAGAPVDMDMQRMMQMHDRMMADPVIRERIATDPVLQRMMREMQGSMPAVRSTGGMNMGGMNMGPPVSEEDRRQAVEFAVRLLSDPAVEARVHADPELHRLWSDPEVQARLRALRPAQPQKPAATPQHNH